MAVRRDLYELVIDHGGIELIPEQACTFRHVPRWVVWAVLADRLLAYENRTTREIAERLRLTPQHAQAADAVLLDAGLIVPTPAPVGVRGGCGSGPSDTAVSAARGPVRQAPAAPGLGSAGKANGPP